MMLSPVDKLVGLNHLPFNIVSYFSLFSGLYSSCDELYLGDGSFLEEIVEETEYIGLN